MGGEWRSARLGDVAQIFDGPHATPKTVDTGPVFLGIDALDQGRIKLSATRHVTEDDFRTWTRRVAPRAGDIVFSYETRIGQAALVPEGLRCCLGRRLALMRCDPALVNNRFFLFQYLSPAYQDYLRAHTIPGSTVDRLHLTAVPDFTVALPPRVEQDAIADLLGALDDKVEVNRRVAETLEGMARALFRSWFVDFDPVRAKAAGRPTGLPDDLAALFPATLDDDGLPEGWRKARLDDVVASVVQRASPSPATAALPYVPIDAIRAKSITGIDAQDGSGAQSSLVSFRRDDILFGAMRPYFHKVALAPAEGTTRTTVFVLRPRLATDLMFALLLASGDETVDFATSGASGSTIPYATWDGALSLMPTTLPTPSIRAAFGKIVEPLVRKAQATIEESRTLAALRDTLLPRLISGELRIANAEREVAAA